MGYVRVKDNGTGHEYTRSEEWAKRQVKGAVTVLDKPAVDVGGDPLPMKPKESIERAATRRSPARKRSTKKTAKRAAKKTAAAPAGDTSTEENS